MMIALFASGFFVGASLLFAALYGLNHGFFSASIWLCSDFWVVEFAFGIGSVFAAFGSRSWLTTRRRSFTGGLFSGLVLPILCAALLFCILAGYGWIAEGHPLSLFR